MRTLATWVLCLLQISLAGAEPRLAAQLETAGDNGGEIDGFLKTAQRVHGDFGIKAARFLVAGMPARDLRSLKKEFLLENLNLAMTAREKFAWARALPDEVFFNDVVPYASLDETRERWRPEFYEQCRELVADSRSATEAAQAINRGLFKIINVHYNTGRKEPNQSPSESKRLGMATCTGLSIILVDACRSVGVPARVAGTALWANKRGNHTWVEIYDEGRWHYTGADEYDPKGLNRAWFSRDASKAIADDWRHAIWATSWQPTGSRFPMVWDLENENVAGINVTDRYAKPVAKAALEATVYVRLWNRRGGERMAAELELLESSGKTKHRVTTKAGTTDLNDMPFLQMRCGTPYRLVVERQSEVRWQQLHFEKSGESTQDLFWDELGKGNVRLKIVKDWLMLLPEERHLSVPEGALSKKDAKDSTKLIWQTLVKESREERKKELDAKSVTAAGKEMKYLEKEFGNAAAGERSLWISMHGGGGAPTRVNDQQWRNQIRLYAPDEGIVVAPRAPTDTWNLWHQGHIDDLFSRLISNMVTERGVSPERVYLLGYSAGGDGVYQLAPRMADRFAAASMMAGHPNNANPLGLRNLPFMIFVGGNDRAYKRNTVAALYGRKLAQLKQADPGGYDHKVTIYEGMGHWMKGKDREALPWLAERTRVTWPKKVVWHQSGRTHNRFYWLAVPKGTAKAGQTVEAKVAGQRIEIQATGLKRINLRLSDKLVDLDKPITVIVNGEEKFDGMVHRNAEAIWQSLRERMDRRSVASGIVELKF